MKSSKAICVILTLLMVVACDTKNNIKSPEESYFYKFFGDEGSQTGVDFVVNTDGTMVLFGTTQEPGKLSQFYVAKADPKGNLLWQHTYGDGYESEARDIELTSSNNLVIVGNSLISAGNRDLFIMTLTPDGDVIKSKRVGYQTISPTVGEADEDVTSVTEISDGFIVTGSTGNLTDNSPPIPARTALFARFDNDLEPKVDWQYPPVYSHGDISVATKCFQQGNKFYVFGYTKFNSNTLGETSDFNFWYFFLNDSGVPSNVITGSENTIGSTGVDEVLTSVTHFSGQGYFLSGIVKDNSGNADVYVVLLKPSTATPDELTFLDADFGSIRPGPMRFTLGSVRESHVASTFSQGSLTQDYGYLILTNEATTGNMNLYLDKLNSSGTPWSAPAIIGWDGDDFAGSVQELPDGRIGVIGTMATGQVTGETKMALIKLNKDGQFVK